MRGHECEFGAEEWGSFLKESKLSIDLKSMMRESWQDYIAVLQGGLQAAVGGVGGALYLSRGHHGPPGRWSDKPG